MKCEKEARREEEEKERETYDHPIPELSTPRI